MDGKALRVLRKQAGLSQWSVARAVGKTQGWLSNIELGYVTPSGEEVLNIAVTIKALVGSNPNHQPDCVVNP